MKKVDLKFHRRETNQEKVSTLLNGEGKGIYSLKVVPNEKQTTCNFSHQFIGYTVQTLSGTVVASVAFQRDAKTLITILEGQTYSKAGLAWNKASITGNSYIHLKDTSMIPSGIIEEVKSLLPGTKISTVGAVSKRREVKLSPAKLLAKEVARIKKIKRAEARAEGGAK